MKTWIKRSLIGLAITTTLIGGLAVAHGHRHGWHRFNEADIAQMKERMVDRIGSKLELDATQKAKLKLLADQLQAQRLALRAGSGEPRAELQSLIAGPAFDRSKASNLLNAKIGAVQAQGPGVISAAADFYDSLNPAQQSQVREFMSRHRRGD